MLCRWTLHLPKIKNVIFTRQIIVDWETKASSV